MAGSHMAGLYCGPPCLRCCPGPPDRRLSSSHVAHHSRAPQVVSRRHGGRRARPGSAAGRVLRTARPQRRRQDHHDRDLRGPHRARFRARSKSSGCAGTTDRSELRQRLGIQLQETQLSDKLTVRGDRAPVPQLFPPGRAADGSDRAWCNSRRSAMRAWAVFPAGRSSASRWPAPWWAIPICSSWTSPPPASTRRRAASSGS